MLTKKKAIEMTRELWTELAKHPRSSKELIFKEKGWPKMRAGCPCCEYVNQFSNILIHGACEKLCPLKWPLGRCCPITDFEASREKHYFDHWREANTLKEKAYYAKLISKLPERR